MTAFINEFHYDNTGGDVGEFIEVAVSADSNLIGWSLVLYNGSNGLSYNTIDLSDLAVADGGAGFGFALVNLPANGLQNGAPDGIALVDDNGAVVEFLSYEGAFTAMDGPAEGIPSIDIGIEEPGNTPIGQSLQRQGMGDGALAIAADFAFAGPLAATPGAVNEGQSFGDVALVLPSLVINEFLADPANDEAGDANGDGVRSATTDEFIEIVNTGDSDVDLSGITISDGVGVRHVFADETTLAAGAAIVVFGGGTPIGEFGGATVVTASSGALGLNNGGDDITLATADGEIIQTLSYGSEGGQNVSLTRDPDLVGAFVQHDVATGADGALFSPGTLINGDPFLAPAPPTPVLTINEIHADPANDLPGDANGDGVRDFSDDEFVEIVNTGDFEADLSGVTISDGVQLRHAFADGTTLAVGAAIVVFGGGTPSGEFGGAQVVTASTGAVGLNNGGDTITIAAADGTLIAELVYGSEGGNNQSLTLDPDLTGAFAQHSDAENANGALFSPGTLIDGTPFIAPNPVFTINEVDADTPGTDLAEFIEIYDGGVGGASLDGLVVVLFNGSDNQSYQAFDLDGFTTDENGFFVLGNTNVANVDLDIGASNVIQNGADAVALYTGNAADFPNDTALTMTNLLDAIVYDTNDGDDAELLVGLGRTEQFNEDENGLKDTQSNSRNPDGTGGFVLQAPTPGESNVVIAPPELVLISEIQGSTNFDGFVNLATSGVDDRSALEGQTIRIQAIVTADFQSATPGVIGTDLNGFYVQEEDADADGDVFSSEGIFIFDDFAEGNPDVQVGDQVEITGTVSEFFGETQISATMIEVLISNQTLPTATVVTLGDTGVMLDQDGDYVANLEAYEGMRVTLPQTLAVTEQFQLGRFGTMKVSADGQLEQFTQNNAPDVDGYDQHLQDIAARTIVLDDGTNFQNPDTIRLPDGNDGILTADDSFRMGDTLTNVTGVLSYSENFQSGSEEPEFRIHLPEAEYEATNPRTDAPEDVGGTFKVAALNVLNYFTTLDDGSSNAGPDNNQDARGADDLTRFGVEPAEAEFERQAEKIIQAVIAIDADVLGLIELENDDDIAIADLVARVNDALGANVYTFIATGDVGTDAITNGIIYKVDAVNPVGDVAILDDAAFVDPLNAGRNLNRPAVTQTFEDLESGELITVSVNHFKSKGSLSGDPLDEDQLDGQGNNNATRTAAAEELANWLSTDPTGQGAENQMVVGDLNSYAMEDPLTALANAGFANTLTSGDSSFVFDGQTGSLDYILINQALADNLSGATVWDINSPEANVIDYNLDFGRDAALFNGDSAARNSDHDPLVAGFNFEALPELNPVLGTAGRDNLIGTDGADAIRSLAGSYDRMTGGEGADEFIFGAETSNGVRERDVIMDYEVGFDSIVLEAGTTVASVRETSTQVVVFLDGDRDAIYVRGDGVTADNLTIITDDVFGLV